MVDNIISKENVSLDELFSFLTSKEKETLVDILKNIAVQQTKTCLSKYDNQALEEYRKRHPDLSKNQNKAKVIRKKEEYQEILKELGKSDVSVDEEIKSMQKISSIDQLANIISERQPPDTSRLYRFMQDLIYEDMEQFDFTNTKSKLCEKVRNVLVSKELDDYAYDVDYSQRMYWYYHPLTHYKLDSYNDIRRMVEERASDTEHEQGSIAGYILGYCSDDGSYDDDVWRTMNEDYSLNSSTGRACIELCFHALGDEYTASDIINDCVGDLSIYLKNDINCFFDNETALSLIESNPHYSHLFAADAEMEQALLTRMPENPIDLYPNARSIKRHFTLHVGPTNSGKTHDAIKALGAASSGVYLGPLRLLAYEQYEKLNEQGCACSLVTGEELKEVAGARHTSSTIEMLNFNRAYDVAVIDEAQMINDRDRGNRWSEAIIGVAAKEVHVCMAPEAEKLVVKLIETCGDTYEIVKHKRFTPLNNWETKNYIEKEVEKGDALIVFSRRAVHAVAADLRAKGHSVSIIYGALPYDVRHAQAESFASGKTDVVVATDAIGMGMNLPIKRIVFMEQAKFDGKERRFLKSTEVKQIAGRAGRFGIHEEGMYSSIHELKKMIKLFRTQTTPLSVAPLGFSPSLLGVEGKVSSLMRKWASMEVSQPFSKLSCEREIEFAEELEDLSSSDAKSEDIKKLVYRFATMPFNDRLGELRYIWHQMFLSEKSGTPYAIRVPRGELSKHMEVLEAEYAEMDLLFQYCRTFGYSEYYEDIQNRRDLISAKMIEMLDKQNVFEPKRCRECGKKLPWNWPYPMCDKCHDRLYGRRNRYDYW